jgi:hypothetical protein
MTNVSILDETPGTVAGLEVDWQAPTIAEFATDRAHPRAPMIAAGVAAAICLIIAGLGWLMAPEGRALGWFPVPVGWVIGVVGLPGTTFLAWRMGARVATATRPGAAGIAFGLAVGTILVADALVVALAVVSASIGSLDSWSIDGGATFLATLFGGIVFGLFLFMIGAILVGIPVAIVVVPAALIWAALVRFLVGRLA